MSAAPFQNQNTIRLQSEAEVYNDGLTMKQCLIEC